MKFVSLAWVKIYVTIFFYMTFSRDKKTLMPVKMVIIFQLGYMLTGVIAASAQSSYTLVGSASLGTMAGCIQLTNSGLDQTGAVWFDKRLHLTKSFDLTFTINLGNDPEGADGMVLVFQTQGNQVLGGPAGGLGYRSLLPSLGVEFDTNRNFELGDPTEDHIALVRNGISDHRLNTGFPMPVPILATLTTVKDGRDHNVKIRWDAITHTLGVEVDCVLRIKQTIDLVNTIFSGTSEVIWGFTAATGGRGNIHTVCISKEEIDTIQACRNDRITLTAPLSFNNVYQWTPSIGLDNSRTRTPHLKVANSQLYRVEYFDGCAQPKFDSVFVNAKGLNFSIGDDRQLCENDTATLVPTLVPDNIPVTYRWSTGQITSQLKTTTSGQYSLTITAEGCPISDSALVIFNPIPRFGLLTESIFDCPNNQLIQLDPQATGAGLQYSWSPESSRMSTQMADTPGTYTVRVTTDMGCSAIQKFIILDNCLSPKVFVPDAFSPNGDGINDFFQWQDSGNLETRMKVFDRWGEVLFVSTNFAPYWDGTYQGKLCPPAIYSWSLEYWPRLTTNQYGLVLHGKVLLLK